MCICIYKFDLSRRTSWLYCGQIFLSDKIEIDFAYQSFKWTNNAKGNAGVTVIIIGLRNISNKDLNIFSIINLNKVAKNINPYLVDIRNNCCKRNQ